MMAKVDNKNIEYEVLGKGMPLVLLHGWGGSIDSLYKLAQLASKKYKVVILSLPGFGASDLPDKDWGVYKYSDFIYKFLKEGGLFDNGHKPILFGHSFGGGIASVLASKSEYADKFRAVILCAAAIKRESASQRQNAFSRIFNSRFYQSIKKFLYPIRKVAYKILFGNTGYLQHPRLERNFQKIITQDLLKEVKQINIPLLLLWGVDDKQTPITDLSHILKARGIDFDVNKKSLDLCNKKDNKIRASKKTYYMVFNNASHGLPLKQPDTVYKYLNEFIRNHYA
jgi:pimeloyl-ACP methyl ester carboxylesterase